MPRRWGAWRGRPIYIVHQLLIFLIVDHLPGVKALLLAHAVAGSAALFVVVLALPALLATAIGRARTWLCDNARRFAPWDKRRQS